MAEEAIRTLLQERGLMILFVLALIEGPVVTVIAGALAARGVFDPLAVMVVALSGDMLGDVLLYAAGRFCPGLAGRLFGPRLPRQACGVQAVFARRGGWLLVIGKLTHVAGFAVILAAGFARMRVGPFLAFTLAGSLPKVVGLAGAGWVFGLSVAMGDAGAGLGRALADDPAMVLLCAGILAGLLAAGVLLGRRYWRRTCV